MQFDVKKEDVDLLTRIISTLYDWNGVSEDTPDDYEVLPGEPGRYDSVTVGDLKDASTVLTNLKNSVK